MLSAMYEVSSTSYGGESFFAPLTATSKQLQMHAGCIKTDVFKIQMNWYMISVLLSWSFV